MIRSFLPPTTRTGTEYFPMSSLRYAAGRTSRSRPKQESWEKTQNDFTAGTDMRTRPLVVFFILSLIIVGLTPDQSDAADASRKVRMAFTSLSAVMMPPWLAHEAGIFN